MTLAELIASFRVDSDDKARSQGGGQGDLLWPDADVARWFGEAEEEAAIRKRLLFDDFTLAIVRIDVLAGQSSYALDSRMFEVSKARLLNATTGRHLEDLYITTREALDQHCRTWRDDRRRPGFFIQDDTRIVLPGIVDRAYTLRLEGYRTPLDPITADSDPEGTTPEISAIHHRFLVHWVLHRAYGKQDADTFDPNRSAEALARFEQYFGLRPDADLRKDQQADQPHHNVAYW
ncbi:hypothetical protein J2W32_004476 [Variovorax boronicumulans]|uniref:Uncharacterized protein n=1 Tax=Variovorax boronicumulans TaxID=436515 RepID=A0AAW8CVC6_9BURK|nr:DUF6682 family protein [Variovorax boronicumulans]MDP9895378.1 hypothetical protein [Variovorax boronicumulans]MDQ0055418.1 hypothetical protein [Variovorax boronicumulans]